MVHGVLDIFKFRIPADYDNGTGYACGLAALYQPQTGHAVHAHIGDYDFRTVLFGGGPGLQPITGLVNFLKFIIPFL